MGGRNGRRIVPSRMSAVVRSGCRARERDRPRAPRGEPQDGGPLDVERVENGGIQIGLALRAAPRLQRRPEIAGSGRSEEFAATVPKMSTPGESKVEAPGSAVTHQHRRSLALSRQLRVTPRRFASTIARWSSDAINRSVQDTLSPGAPPPFVERSRLTRRGSARTPARRPSDEPWYDPPNRSGAAPPERDASGGTTPCRPGWVKDGRCFASTPR